MPPTQSRRTIIPLRPFRARRSVVVLLILFLLPACYSWRPTSVSPVTLIPEERPPQVRVTTNGGERVTVLNPVMRNDTIVGRTSDGLMRLAPPDVTRLEVRQFSPVRTTALVVGHVAAGLTFIIAVIAIQPHYRGL